MSFLLKLLLNKYLLSQSLSSSYNFLKFLKNVKSLVELKYLFSSKQMLNLLKKVSWIDKNYKEMISLFIC